ncbi:DNA-binding transcriptional regulator, GntR family [Rhizobiales bacterium GAS191]|nr:DNA-binding transcriptional regulator, GntR family [Rhizobiales bacterium GAS191]
MVPAAVLRSFSPRGDMRALSDVRLNGQEDAKSTKASNTKATRLVDRLREAILAGELKPGTKINLENVRREFDVSLSPLREALARLIAVGLVELYDNRGYTVAPVSLSNLAEITRLRVEFESLALSTAIANGDLKWESEVMRALHSLNRTIRDPADPRTLEAWEHAHRDFHMSLLAGCGMPLLLNFCLMLHNLNDRYRRVFLLSQGGDRNVAAEHSEIAQGAVARDAAFASDKLREHIQRTGTNLRNRLSDSLEP